MEIERSLRFIEDDAQWVKKLGIGALLSLFSVLIVPGFILSGYSIAVARKVMTGKDTPLPEWDSWKEYLKDGFYVAVAGFIYALPMLILIIIGAIMGGTFTALSRGDSDALTAAGGGIFLLFYCAAMLYGLVVALLSPAIMLQYLRYGSLGACLRFSEVIALTRTHIRDIVISMLVVLGVVFVVGILGGILNVIPCLGSLVYAVVMLALTPYLMIVMGHLYGQIGRKIDNKLGF